MKPARTDFAVVQADFAATSLLMLSAQGGIGRTTAVGPFLNLTEPAVSSSWRLTAWTRCLKQAGDCTSVHLQLEQPVRVEHGAFSTLLADAPASYFDPLSFSRRSFSAAPSGREIDLRLGLDRTIKGAGLLQLQVVGVHDQGNLAATGLDLGVSANWRQRF